MFYAIHPHVAVGKILGCKMMNFWDLFAFLHYQLNYLQSVNKWTSRVFVNYQWNLPFFSYVHFLFISLNHSVNIFSSMQPFS